MNYEIQLSGDDVLTIFSLLENAGSASLAVKVRDQMYEQRRMDEQRRRMLVEKIKREATPMTDKNVVDYFHGIIGGE